MSDMTPRIIAGMLKENTGRHFLDSGGAYGRSWERNQKRQFAKERPATVRFTERHGELEIEPTINLYHFLTDRLSYAPDWQRRLTRFARTMPEAPWYEVLEAWRKKIDARVTCAENTYNGESLLSQTIQYWDLDVDGEQVTILQVHGGCDVRGGYTAPKCFTADEYWCRPADAVIRCENDHYWQTDDANHWYEEGSCGRDYKQLETYPAVSADADDRPAYDDRQIVIPGCDPDRVKRAHTYRGYVRVDSDHNGYCPLCGEVLTVWP